jgi:Protein of unknown function (DUF3096)
MSVAATYRAPVGQTPPNTEPRPMTIHLSLGSLQPAIALIAGILILVVPRLLNYVIAIYLIVIGITGLWPNLLR